MSIIATNMVVVPMVPLARELWLLIRQLANVFPILVIVLLQIVEKKIITVFMSGMNCLMTVSLMKQYVRVITIQTLLAIIN